MCWDARSRLENSQSSPRSRWPESPAHLSRIRLGGSPMYLASAVAGVVGRVAWIRAPQLRSHDRGRTRKHARTCGRARAHRDAQEDAGARGQAGERKRPGARGNASTRTRASETRTGGQKPKPLPAGARRRSVTRRRSRGACWRTLRYRVDPSRGRSLSALRHRRESRRPQRRWC